MSRNCAKCSHNHADKHYCTFSEHGEPCLCNQSTPDAVTITISREDANLLADYMELDYPEMTRIARAVRAALEGEQ